MGNHVIIFIVVQVSGVLSHDSAADLRSLGSIAVYKGTTVSVLTIAKRNVSVTTKDLADLSKVGGENQTDSSSRVKFYNQFLFPRVRSVM